MTTDLFAEDRSIPMPFALVRAAALTGTSVEELGVAIREATASQSAAEKPWEIIDSAPPRDSRLDEATYRFSKNIWGLPSVIAVTHAKDGNVNLIWTFIKRRDKAVRKDIYAQERELMAEHPDLLFDFNVVALDQGIHGTLVPDDLQGRVVMYRVSG
jgi:hypothetical protein